MAEETIKSDKLIVHQEKAALYRLGMWLIDHRKAVAFVTYAFTAVMLFFTFRIQMFCRLVRDELQQLVEILFRIQTARDVDKRSVLIQDGMRRFKVGFHIMRP